MGCTGCSYIACAYYRSNCCHKSSKAVSEITRYGPVQILNINANVGIKQQFNCSSLEYNYSNYYCHYCLISSNNSHFYYSFNGSSHSNPDGFIFRNIGIFFFCSTANNNTWTSCRLCIAWLGQWSYSTVLPRPSRETRCHILSSNYRGCMVNSRCHCK
jgi:hypothetical protein